MLVLAVMLVLGLVWLVSALSSDDVTTSQAPDRKSTSLNSSHS